MKILIATLFSLAINASMLDLSIPSADKALVTTGQAQETELNPSSIRLLNWNIYKGKKRIWSRDFNSIASQYDIITLQEIITSKDILNSYKKLTDHERIFGYSFKYNKSGEYTGVATFAKVRASSSKYLPTINTEPVTNTPKVSLYTKYKISHTDKELLVINIHSINFVSLYSYANQLEQVSSQLSLHKGPIILSGDFNSWSAPRMSQLNEVINRHGLSSVRFSPDKRKKVFGLALDHIFFKGLVVNNSKTLTNLKSSDHVAMEVRFSLK